MNIVKMIVADLDAYNESNVDPDGAPIALQCARRATTTNEALTALSIVYDRDAQIIALATMLNVDPDDYDACRDAFAQHGIDIDALES